MKRIICFITLSLLAFPLAAGAAFNDVTLTSSAVISVGGSSLTVTGTNALVQSIVVNPSSFDVVVAAGSSLRVTSGDKKNFTITGTGGIGTVTCDGATSIVTLNVTGSGTLTITPSGTCVGGASSSGSTSSSSSGSGGGVVAVTPPPTAATSTKSASTTASTSTTTQTTTNTSTIAMGNTSNLISTPTISAGLVITQLLRLGSSGDEVAALQKLLIAKGYLVVPENISLGHFGKATERALKKYQKSVGLTPVGVTGPATRAALAADNASGTATNTPTKMTGSVTFTRTLKIGATGDDVLQLQKILISKGFLSDKSPLGYFGGQTQKALKEFQKSNGLDSVGFAGPSTRNMLNTLAPASN